MIQTEMIGRSGSLVFVDIPDIGFQSGFAFTCEINELWKMRKALRESHIDRWDKIRMFQWLELVEAEYATELIDDQLDRDEAETSQGLFVMALSAFAFVGLLIWMGC